MAGGCWGKPRNKRHFSAFVAAKLKAYFSFSLFLFHIGEEKMQFGKNISARWMRVVTKTAVLGMLAISVSACVVDPYPPPAPVAAAPAYYPGPYSYYEYPPYYYGPSYYVYGPSFGFVY